MKIHADLLPFSLNFWLLLADCHLLSIFTSFSKLEDHPLIFTPEAASLHDIEISLSAKKRRRRNTVKHSSGAVTIPSGA